MRRLAIQNRGGSVKSQRDYQSIIDLGKPLTFQPAGAGDSVSVTIQYEGEDEAGAFAGLGMYLAADRSVSVDLRVTDESGIIPIDRKVRLDSQHYWTRVGVSWALPRSSPRIWRVSLEWASAAHLTVWGMNCDSLRLPGPVEQSLNADGGSVGRLNSVHLAPEAFYLAHDSPLCGGSVVGDRNANWAEIDRPTPGKKCSQCQRFLPIDPRLSGLRSGALGAKRAPRNMVLAFHGHRSKKTGYQNECRACKKFEINDHFNPIRTSDQHHESSALTRERKLLLRENLILKQFKERGSKEGLRTFVWERFGRECFNCGLPVTVEGYQLDHTRPLVYLWPLDEHATCLCSDCNNTKKDSFPVEFYSPEKLRLLALKVGLPLEELRVKSVNQAELARIRSDIIGFATSWIPRLFNSVAIRVRDFHPEIDLFQELQEASPEHYERIVQDLRSRPVALLEDYDGLE